MLKNFECTSRMSMIIFKKLLFIILSVFLLFPKMMNCGTKPCLNPYNRPKNIRKAVNSAFLKILNGSGAWFNNGAREYLICDVSDQRLALKIIQSNPKKKSFFFMDFGAGDLTWNYAMAEFLNQQGFPPDVTIHIYGLTGDPREKPRQEKSGNCIIYNYSSSSIEDFSIQDNAGNQIEFDLIVSSSTFQHLADPLGTFVRIYDALGKGGFLGITSLQFAKRKTKEINDFYALINILLTTKANWFMRPLHDVDKRTPFFLQKTNSESLCLPVTYSHRYTNHGYYRKVDATYDLSELSKSQKEIPELSGNLSSIFVSTNKELYEFFLENGLFDYDLRIRSFKSSFFQDRNPEDSDDDSTPPDYERDPEKAKRAEESATEYYREKYIRGLKLLSFKDKDNELKI